MLVDNPGIDVTRRFSTPPVMVTFLLVCTVVRGVTGVVVTSSQGRGIIPSALGIGAVIIIIPSTATPATQQVLQAVAVFFADLLHTHTVVLCFQASINKLTELVSI